MLHRFEGARKPIVLIDRRYLIWRQTASCRTTTPAVMKRLGDLIAAGHTRIGLINLPVSLTPGAGRLAGYTRALAEAGLQLDPALMKEGPYPGNEGAAIFRAMMGAATPSDRRLHQQQPLGPWCARGDKGSRSAHAGRYRLGRVR